MPIEVKNFTTQADEAKDMPNARMEAQRRFQLLTIYKMEKLSVQKQGQPQLSNPK